ncbi:hypothetical protein NDU88_003410 [Pleurodeles waltl]|uniref:Uncharacterized protein n=1 Tax=Pleurodeles waltl TaxID=8319 RepID=A0AAV7VFE1_PLEWA|nr:hypothetical protein NDU88_003410 [Pleurodeles waltl]
MVGEEVTACSPDRKGLRHEVAAALHASMGARRRVAASPLCTGVRQRPGEGSQDLGAPTGTAEGDKRTQHEAATAVRFDLIDGWAGDCARSKI